jgi:aminoglycoside adenylyltransferase-like protein/nucleotidyltransferase-like protein
MFRDTIRTVRTTVPRSRGALTDCAVDNREHVRLGTVAARVTTIGGQAIVETVVHAYLQAIDAEAPGLVEGLYLTGSVALGEFRPHTSDIDFVAVTARRPDNAALAALRRAHSRLRKRWPKPCFDGLYVTWDELAHDSSLAGRGPYSYEGRFRSRGGGPGDPVTWQTVARHGVRCRGPKPTDLNIRIDADRLAQWTLHNFDAYWRQLLNRASRFPHPQSLIALTSWGAAWIVLGVSRLHYTLATGEICSKEAAGLYARQTFSERWYRVLDESLRIRRADRARPDAASAFSELAADLRIRLAGDRSLYRTPLDRRRDAVAFGEMVITDAHERFNHFDRR